MAHQRRKFLEGMEPGDWVEGVTDFLPRIHPWNQRLVVDFTVTASSKEDQWSVGEHLTTPDSHVYINNAILGAMNNGGLPIGSSIRIHYVGDQPSRHGRPTKVYALKFGAFEKVVDQAVRTKILISEALKVQKGGKVVLTKKQADYLGVPVEGPYKAEHYRY